MKIQGRLQLSRRRTLCWVKAPRPANQRTTQRRRLCRVSTKCPVQVSGLHPEWWTRDQVASAVWSWCFSKSTGVSMPIEE